MSNDVKINQEALDDFLKNDLGDFLSDTKAISETVETLALETTTKNTPEAITLAVQGFLNRGASVLETMEIYCNNMPDAESVTAFASLISSLSSAINNIASVHNKIQDHENRKDFEDHKHKLKMEEIEHREKIKALYKSGPEGGAIGEAEVEELVEYNTADIINTIIDREKDKI